MILVTGPTGSGKSTTLYATLNAVSKPEINVITVEDPVEYRMAGINQVQVNPKAGLTFAGALRSILRSDPDVVLLGEIRDHETAQIAIEAALTGHLVLSTLHTNDAPSAVTRLIEMGIEPFLVGSALDCVVAQRLARRLCDKCKEPYQPSPEELARRAVPVDAGRADPRALPPGRLRHVLEHRLPRPHRAARGHAGDRGDRAARRRARRRARRSPRRRVAQGMITLRKDGWHKVALGSDVDRGDPARRRVTRALKSDVASRR